MFPRKGVFYMQDTTTGKQTSLRTKDETEARSLLNAENEAHRQPVLNLQLARAYLSASDPAFTQRTWQSVMEHFQARGKESSRERYATVFKSKCLDGLRGKVLLETTPDDFFAIFKIGKASVVYFLKSLHNLALELGWIVTPIVAPYLWPKYKPKARRGVTADEYETILAAEKHAEWRLFLELLWETGAAQSDAVIVYGCFHNFISLRLMLKPDWNRGTVLSTQVGLKARDRFPLKSSRKCDRVPDSPPLFTWRKVHVSDCGHHWQFKRFIRHVLANLAIRPAAGNRDSTGRIWREEAIR